MCPRLIVAFLLILISQIVVCQNSVIDNLEKEIANAQLDSTKARLTNNLAKIYWDIDLDKSIQLAYSAIKLTKKQNNYFEESRGYNVIGVAYFRKRDMTKSFANYNNSLDISIKHKYNDNIKKSIYNIATLYSHGLYLNDLDIKKYLNILISISKSDKIEYITLMPFILFDGKLLSFKEHTFNIVDFLDKAISNNDPKLINLKNIAIAGHYRFIGEYFKSIVFTRKVLNNTNDSLFVLLANEIQGEINFILRRFKEAKINEEVALQIIYKSSDPFIKTKTKLSEGGLGCVLIELKEYKQAYKFIKQLINDQNNPYNYAIALNNMAVIYMKLDSIDLAEPYLNKALIITDSLKIYPIHLAALNTKYELQTIQKSNEIAKTIKEIEKTIPNVTEWYSVYDGYKLLKDYYKSKGNLNKSLFYIEKLMQVNDTIKNKEISQLLEELSVKYETEKKDEQIALQNKIILNMNNVIFALVVVGLVLLLFIVLLFFIINKNKTIELLNRIKLENELQLNTLRSKIIPHFTKNVLSAIGHFAMTDKLKAGHYISVFSKFTGLTLANADKNYIALSDELEYIEKYLELEKMRFGDNFEYKISIDNDVSLQILIPSMTLHTYCDNAIRHGLVNKIGTGLLIVEIQNKPDGVTLTIIDNGIGRKRATELGTEGNGQGLKLIQAQMDFYNQKNQIKMNQEIIDLEDLDGNSLGTRIELFVPNGYLFL